MPNPSYELQVPARALPQLIAAHESALRSAQDMLTTLGNAGRIPEPWTQDPVAQDITARFNTYAVDGPGSAYDCLRQYQQELARVTQTLKDLHSAYQAGEATNVATLRSL